MVGGRPPCITGFSHCRYQGAALAVPEKATTNRASAPAHFSAALFFQDHWGGRTVFVSDIEYEFDFNVPEKRGTKVRLKAFIERL